MGKRRSCRARRYSTCGAPAGPARPGWTPCRLRARRWGLPLRQRSRGRIFHEGSGVGLADTRFHEPQRRLRRGGSQQAPSPPGISARQVPGGSRGMGVDLRFHQPGAFGRPGFSPIERCDSAPRRGPPPVHARGGRNAPARHRLSCRWRPHGGTSGPTGVRWEELEHIIRCLASGLQKGGCDSGGGTEAQG